MNILNGRLFLAICLSFATLGAGVLPCDAVDSKWTIENVLSAKEIEISADNSVVAEIASASCERQLAEMALNDGDNADATRLLETAINSWKRYLKFDDMRIQSARLALAEAQMNSGDRNGSEKLLRSVLTQQLLADQLKEKSIRKKLSSDERKEKGVESELQFEERCRRQTWSVTSNTPSAAVHRAQLLFWDNRLLDALRLTKLSLALLPATAGSAGKKSGATANSASFENSIDSASDALFLQAMIFYARNRRDLVADARRKLSEMNLSARTYIEERQARLSMVDGLIADLEGKHSSAIELYEAAVNATRKNEDRYETLLFQIYKGNSLLLNGDPPAAYRDLNHVFETSRRLVEGREKGLLYHGMAQEALLGMYETLLVRLNVEHSTAESKTGSFVEDYQGLAEALYHVGYQFKTTRRQKLAQRCFWNSVYIFEKYLPDKKRQLGGTLYDLAESYFWSEDYDIAIAVFKRCAEVRREMDPISLDYIMTLNTLGRVYLASGDAISASDTIKSSLYRLMHREQMQASRISRLVSDLNKKKVGGDNASYQTESSAPELVASGDQFLNLLCTSSLTSQLDQVADARRRADPDVHSQMDDLWQVLADSYSRNKRYDEAAEVSRRLLKQRKDSRNSSRSEILGSLWQLAYICGVSNRLEDAEKYYSEMIDSDREANVRHLAAWYYARGVVADSLGHTDTAESDFRKAIAENKKFLKTLDKIEDKETYEHTVWLIYDLEQELKAKRRVPPSASDYLKGYETCYWNLNRFPLKVYIDNSEQRGFGPKLYEYMKKAVDEWSETPGMEGRIKFVDDREDADIYFERVSNYDQIPYGSGGGASASFVRRGNKTTKEIDRVHLRLFCKEHDLDKLSNHAVSQLYTLALHEFGHGLGLAHSPSGLDVMYWKSAMYRLSSRDKASLLRIYGFKEGEPRR
jgi:predicted Zn-dependent protease